MCYFSYYVPLKGVLLEKGAGINPCWSPEEKPLASHGVDRARNEVPSLSTSFVLRDSVGQKPACPDLMHIVSAIFHRYMRTMYI